MQMRKGGIGEKEKTIGSELKREAYLGERTVAKLGVVVVNVFGGVGQRLGHGVGSDHQFQWRKTDTTI